MPPTYYNNLPNETRSNAAAGLVDNHYPQSFSSMVGNMNGNMTNGNWTNTNMANKNNLNIHSLQRTILELKMQLAATKRSEAALQTELVQVKRENEDLKMKLEIVELSNSSYGNHRREASRRYTDSVVDDCDDLLEGVFFDGEDNVDNQDDIINHQDKQGGRPRTGSVGMPSVPSCASAIALLGGTVRVSGVSLSSHDSSLSHRSSSLTRSKGSFASAISLLYNGNLKHRQADISMGSLGELLEEQGISKRNNSKNDHSTTAPSNARRQTTTVSDNPEGRVQRRGSSSSNHQANEEWGDFSSSHGQKKLFEAFLF